MFSYAKNVRLACISLAPYGSLWLPLLLSLALTATLWHTLALSGSLLLSNFVYTVLDRLSGPLLGSQRRCHADALCPCLLLSSIKSNHHKKMMRKTWDNDEAWYRTQHDTGPVPEDPFPFIPNWPIPNLRHTHNLVGFVDFRIFVGPKRSICFNWHHQTNQPSPIADISYQRQHQRWCTFSSWCPFLHKECECLAYFGQIYALFGILLLG